jgi:hypothetical protein
VALDGGRDWQSQIEAAQRSKALQHFILMLTSQASPVVRRKIRLARREGKTFQPIRGAGLSGFSDQNLSLPEKTVKRSYRALSSESLFAFSCIHEALRYLLISGTSRGVEAPCFCNRFDF